MPSITPIRTVLPLAAGHVSTPAIAGSPPTAPAVFGMWEQYLINYAVNRVWSATAGPAIRQAVERMLGRPHTPAWTPPATVGFTIRDIVSGITGLVIGQAVHDALSGAAHQGARSGGRALTSAGGLSGATAAAMGRLTLAGVGRIFMETSILTVVFSALDAVFSNMVGPAIERNVGLITGEGGRSTTQSRKNGTIPNQLMKTSPEQLARNIVRGILGGVTYTLTSATIGIRIAGLVAGVVPGIGGVLLGGIASAFAGSAAVSLEERLLAGHAADAAQNAVRGVERLLGHRLAPRVEGDVVPVPGDRISGSFGGVLVPFGTALLTGQPGAFAASIIPRPHAAA